MFLKSRRLDNLFFATIQKSGSQWINAVLDDPRIRKFTGLKTYPQHRYEWDDFHKNFPKGTFVPGLYMSYPLYEEISKPEKYKTFYVTRDPRNVVVSWYYSMLKTHTLIGKVGKYRRELEKLDFDQGIHYCIDALSIKFMAVRTWHDNRHDPNVLFLKFEELTQDPVQEFLKIFNHCDIKIDKQVLEDVLQDYSKNKMREKDLANRGAGAESHYRKKASSYKDSFNQGHYEHFYNVTGNLVTYLGYPE